VGQRLFLVDGSLSSTHILKPEPLSSTLPLMVANEHFCMALASRISRRRFGEDHIAQVDILRVPDPVLSIARFDRQAIPGVFAVGPDDVKIPVSRRVHIIDGCQATGLPVSAKYERNMGVGKDVEHIRDGLSFEKLFACREFLEQPLMGMRRLLLWQATTLLFGNSDAHGKNISFYAGRAGLRVAELYDLVSVQQYDSQKLEHSLAMAFGDEFLLNTIKSFALADNCERTKVDRSFFARELAALCEIARQEAPLQALDPIYQGAEVEMVEGIAAFVVQQATRLQALTKDIPKFKKDVF
jgi:serine/threonine-protein kinase HipA